jgi:hypothetical protein
MPARHGIVVRTRRSGQVADRSTSIPVFGVLALLLATAALPSNAGTIDPRGPLGEAERATVELFERVSPSVATTTKPVTPRRDAEPFGGPEFFASRFAGVRQADRRSERTPQARGPR